VGIKMKVYVLDCGKQEVDKRVILSSAAIADADHHHPEAIWTWIPTWAILIDHPQLGYILYDTAISPDAMRERWDIGMQKSGPYIVQEDSTLPARLYQLHVEPEQIGTVIMSHLHNDHAGCLHLFKNATVYVHDDELKHAMKHYMTREELPPYCWFDLDLACRAELKWKTIKKEDGEIIDLAEDLHIVNFGSGHAHGMLGISWAHGFLDRMDLITESAIAFLKIEDWNFHVPVFFGDTLHAEIVVKEIIPSRHKPDR